jgi:hypothetical protein
MIRRPDSPDAPRRVLWRSTDSGKTWTAFVAHTGSILANTDIPPGETYDDGYNWYRSTPPKDAR